MIALLMASAYAQQPWQVGPSPSASPAEKGLAFAAHGTVLGDARGGRVTAAFAPSERLWFSGEVGSGSGWRTCPDCSVPVAFTGTGRVTALKGEKFKLAGFGLVSSAGEDPRFAAGVAAELGSGRVRLDASVPLWASEHAFAPLAADPELGLQIHWGDRQASRVAAVGLVPSLAATHRVRLGIFGLEATARAGIEVLSVEAGARLQF